MNNKIIKLGTLRLYSPDKYNDHHRLYFQINNSIAVQFIFGNFKINIMKYADFRTFIDSYSFECYLL